MTFIKKPRMIMQGWRADRTGLEPATSAVTGRHSNQLNYRSIQDCSITVRRKYTVYLLIKK
jgi:hypothetical protein